MGSCVIWHSWDLGFAMNTMPEWALKENLRAFYFMTLPLLDQNVCCNNYYCAEKLLFDQ